MGIQPSRIVPRIGPEHYKSYSMRAPLSTHWKRGTCAEYECDAHLFGWTTVVDISTDLGRKRAHFIIHDKTRRCTVERDADIVRFHFEPGQTCFDQDNHRVGVGREPIVLVQEGDWRGNPRKTPPRIFNSVEDWRNDFAEHQDKLARAIGG
jgi:hypothetical protein